MGDKSLLDPKAWTTDTGAHQCMLPAAFLTYGRDARRRARVRPFAAERSRRDSTLDGGRSRGDGGHRAVVTLGLRAFRRTHAGRQSTTDEKVALGGSSSTIQYVVDTRWRARPVTARLGG